MNPANRAWIPKTAPALALVMACLPTTGPAQSARATPGASAMFINLDGPDEFPPLTSPESGVKFDIDGNGDHEQVAWTKPNANVALLALDVNRDGRITSGKELFGSHMVPEAGNGPNTLLRVFDRSGAAISEAVHQGHRLYEEILLWVDLNHNGVSEPPELRLAKRPVHQNWTGVHQGRPTRRSWQPHSV